MEELQGCEGIGRVPGKGGKWKSSGAVRELEKPCKGSEKEDIYG